MDECTDRIIKVMQEERMNASQFSNAIGVQKAAISHITSGRNNASFDVIKKILNKFDTINPDWLIMGKGSMRRQSRENSVDNSTVSFDNNDLDLFSQPIRPISVGNAAPFPTTHHDDNIRTEINPTAEKSAAAEVYRPDNSAKVAEKEVVIYKERTVKTIDKLLIFYSDNTYETFLPEKHND